MRDRKFVVTYHRVLRLNLRMSKRITISPKS